MPTKSTYDESRVGARAQANYDFLKKLWKEKDSELRYQLNEAAGAGVSDENPRGTPEGEARLKALLVKEGIEIPADARLTFIDFETLKTYDYCVDPKTVDYYAVMIPPALRAKPDDDDSYKDAQARTLAWYHATADSCGM